ncbi:MAG: hypothetical protein A2Y67_00520 [Candidatus Buchananbacteria bacterium RBG_13_39_9]|uniref:Glycerophosphoryl diester phosphodiesterase membrane domain-containing protein n=1 Tax=Candidatus Buchananbacteria bacterium RBG_13_39_9 TaxID=1797531 RepID=A0A1G1XMB1_9BACT|nr:MAG: hypothetical protein A2Y67_00520 [Candidatus Buchananbacteria bacterium RBG_13_39_9]
MENILSKKPLTLAESFLETFKLLKATWLTLVVFSFLIICLFFVSLLLLTALNLVYIALAKTIPPYTFNLIYTVIVYILYFLLSTLAQILLINALFRPSLNFKENIATVKKFFKNYLFLSIFTSFIIFLCFLPFYTALFFFLLNNYILGFLSLIINFALIVLAASYFIFSPYILIDKNYSWHLSVKKSWLLAKNNLLNITLKIFVFVLILVILDSLSTLLLYLPYAGPVFAMIIFMIMVLFFFAYPFVIYSDYKQYQNI